MTNKTPRTDAEYSEASNYVYPTDVVTVEFARKLEAELAALEQQRRENVRKAHKFLVDQSVHVQDNANKLRQWEFEKDEARCRELVGMYLGELAFLFAATFPDVFTEQSQQSNGNQPKI